MLTAKQRHLLQFIQLRLEDSGVSPSFDEMKDALGLKSKSGVHRLIKALEERGFIRRLPNRARALEVLKPLSLAEAEGTVATTDAPGAEPSNVVRPNFGSGPQRAPLSDGEVEIPLHGRIAAGTPIEALESTDSFINVPAAMIGRGQHYALTVDGESMVDLGILDGDTVIIESCDTARDGDIIVALVDDEEATLKTMRRLEGGQLCLEPANRTMRPQVYDARRVRVQGRLRGLLRQY